jgi:linoleoyl-CoA desaturase
MEIGHNVMHGQYDWMREPGLNSTVFEWDTVCPAEQWKHSHNYRHHTFTNILDEDRDIGYGVLRIDQAQQWRLRHLANPAVALGLMLGFEWGVMMHDLEVESVWEGNRSWAEVKPMAAQCGRKISRQVLKDYLVFPALTGPLFPLTLLGNATANLVRNVWAFSIIFCGHFPSGVQTFTREETADETRGEWYVRQVLGSANIRGGRLFHILSGNLSHQIEHHLFPDLPAHRYPEIAPGVEALCHRYGVPYNTGGFFHQIGTVWRKICTFALPPRWVKPSRGPAVIVGRRTERPSASVPAGV